ncbi:MAG: efflux RND transporter periplasmic adaptor subunit [Hyphomicrobiales bacterium]|nr:MAG: efflux RND transporter periplasmic adaptor subunit [Hyphomicrobiales bacterium]
MGKDVTIRRSLVVCVLALAVFGCREQSSESDKLPTLVRVETVAFAEHSETIELTGEIRARVQNDLAFKVAGRIVERFADVGDHVAAGTTIARLSPHEQQADLEAAEASVRAAEAVLRQAKTTLERQKALLGKGFTTRRQFDTAEEAFRVAEGTLDASEARLSTARQNLADTELKAEADGVVTARSGEVGQVVLPGQAVFTFANDGPRDAVFDVFETLLANELATQEMTVSLVSDPAVTTTAILREVSPTVDATKGTVRVKFGIDNPPAGLTLQASVAGKVRLKPERLALLSWSALTVSADGPAVWVLEPESRSVSLRPVEVARHERDVVMIRSGVEPGEQVVAGGSQLLHVGQVVAVAGAGEGQ